MDITTLRAGQVFYGYVAAGSRIHLTAGALCLRAPASWGEAHAYALEIDLSEGASYQVQRAGWWQIRAKKDAEFLSEAPAPLVLSAAKKFFQHKRLQFGTVLGARR